MLADDADSLERAAARLISQAIAAACGEEPCTCGAGCRDVAIHKSSRTFDEMMAFAEEVKKPYLQPQLLRDLSHLRAYLAEMAEADQAAAAPKPASERLSRMLAEVG